MTSKTCNGKCKFYGMFGTMSTESIYPSYCDICNFSFCSHHISCPCCHTELKHSESKKEELKN